MKGPKLRQCGYSLGACFAIVDVSCALVTFASPNPIVLAFFNNLTHGVDFSPLIRWDVPWWETVLGTLEVFVLGSLPGAIGAAIYNCG